MAKQKIKLELTWIGKENRPKLEPRILIEYPEKSYHAGRRVSENDIFDNRLIYGDNLLALKALEQEFGGKIKCIFIDPPYNTGSAFRHYDDGVEHSLWLSLMRDRLEILRRLLTDDGSLWITIDDNECHYLKVLCDEIFGRVNCFDQSVKRYYRRRSLRKEGSESRREDRPSMWYAIKAPNGSNVWPLKPDGTEGRWRWKEENVLKNTHLLEYIQKTDRWEIYVKQYLDENATRPPGTIWLQEEVGHNHEAKLEAKTHNPEQTFDTPKPERLLHYVLTLATNPCDLVLDSFLGSGTTTAVAHNIGRRWIGIELGEHCLTHCIPRLKKVIDGEDAGGITKAVNWKGGGGFRYYRLGPSLIVEDKWGNPVISSAFNAAMLAEAMCKLEGFEYAPSEDVYWIHGKSTETDFLYVTTQFMSKQMLTRLSDEVGPERSLLICCSAFRCDPGQLSNLTIKKIPKAVLRKCEWGHDDYSLEIKNLPKAPPEPREQTEDTPSKTRRTFGKGKAAHPSLFGTGGER